MITLKDVKDILSTMDSVEKRMLIAGLLMEESISYEDLSMAYVNYLESQKQKDRAYKRLLAGCLTSKYSETEDMGYVDARSSILLYPYVPSDFIKEYVLKNTSKEEIEKQKKFLKEEGVEVK